MNVVHAAWGPGGRLNLWAETSEAFVDGAAVAPDRRARPRARRPSDRPGGHHPFATDAFAVPSIDGQPVPVAAGAARLDLRLPTYAGRPLPSPDLRVGTGPVGAGSVSLAPWRVPVVVLEAAEGLRLLLSVPDRTGEGSDAIAGGSLRFFGRAALLALELVARGRVVPWLARDRESPCLRWRPAPGAGDVVRIDALAASMPGACLAALDTGLDTGEDGPAAARHVLDAVLTALIDASVAEPAATVDLPPQSGARRALAQALDRWAETTRPAEGPYRTLFRLREPGHPEAAPDGHGNGDADLDADAQEWRLEVLVGARADPSLVLPAARVWNDPAPLRAAAAEDGAVDPEEALLADLGRASRLYPPLDALLQAAEPDAIPLGTEAAHAFLRDGAPPLVDAGYTVLLPAWWRHRRRRLGLRLRVRSERRAGAQGGVEPGLGASSIVEYDWRVALGEAELTGEELTSLAAAKGGLVRVRGEWVEVERDGLDAALRAVAETPGSGARPPLTVADVFRTAIGLEAAPGGLEVTGVTAEGWLGDLLAADAGPPAPIATPAGFGGVLRPYQERGLGWLAFLDRLGFGGVLADDMGLGKTAQLLALLVAEQSNVPPAERLGPTLIVAPMSLVGNWQREAARFAPSLGVHVHHGGGRLGAAELAEAVRDVDVVITTYALLARDRSALEAITWRRIVLDEAQEIKNSGTDQSRAARALRAPSRFALSGTPIENRLSELWTIMDFANPGFLGSEEAFRNRFGVPIERWNDERAAERLRRLTSPFILRRVKTDRSIVPDLPAKLEFAESCNLTREQATLYQAVVDELLPDLDREEDEQAYRGKVLRAILRLKQVCNHPALFLGDGSPLHGRSGKLERLEELLANVLAAGERALVFTQFTEWGERLVPYLRARFGVEVLYLHGGLARTARDAAVERFAGGSVPVFVLSLKAGGKGLNLVAANHVVHYDRWWNPAVEDQASDRAFRIGQTREVQVRTLVATGTLEERIADMLGAKRELAARIVGAGERALTELSVAELRALLELGTDAVAEDAG